MKLVTVEEFAELTKTKKESLYKMIREERIPYYKIGRQYRLDIGDFKHNNETDFIGGTKWTSGK